MLNSDWQTKVTPSQFEDEFTHRWDGPGYYKAGKDTLIVVNPGRDTRALWHHASKPDEVFDVHVYNDRNIATVLNLFVGLPMRGDLP